jgi:hypothetical protein
MSSVSGFGSFAPPGLTQFFLLQHSQLALCCILSPLHGFAPVASAAWSEVSRSSRNDRPTFLCGLGRCAMHPALASLDHGWTILDSSLDSYDVFGRGPIHHTGGAEGA